jgi:hypothetical protein
MTDARFKCGKSDTSPEARRVQYELHRRMSPGRKLELVFDMYDTGQRLAIAGLRTRHPDASEEDTWHLWARQHLGDDLYEQVYRGRRGFRPSKGGG